MVLLDLFVRAMSWQLHASPASHGSLQQISVVSYLASSPYVRLSADLAAFAAIPAPLPAAAVPLAVVAAEAVAQDGQLIVFLCVFAVLSARRVGASTCQTCASRQLLRTANRSVRKPAAKTPYHF